jgi:epoxyqueuosine reductase
MTPTRNSRWITGIAHSLGFERVGIAPAVPPARAGYYRRWLSAGRAGHMDYLHRNVELRTDPRALLPGAASVIVVASNYHQPVPPQRDDRDPCGRVARYAWGRDYHRVMTKRLSALVNRMRCGIDETFDARVCVDTAPLLEREYAAAAGIGWIGKNTMVLDRALGSYFCLGEVVTTLDLAPDEPVAGGCGTCTRCLDACPTRALHAPYEMDASRCISYLTIELREVIPDELKPRMGNWIFGCDICQEVCPHNRQAPMTIDPADAVRGPGSHPRLRDLLSWTQDDYDRHLRGSAIRRAKLHMLQRNAAIALANVSGSGHERS